jgi:cyclin B
MNKNRQRENKENNHATLNVLQQRKSVRPFFNKELSLNNNLKVEKQNSLNSQTAKNESMFTSKDTRCQNLQEVVEYQQSIFEYLKAKNNRVSVNEFYMNDQRDITAKMRLILIDWLVDVNIKFKLLPQTIFMTVNLIDRYLSKEQVARQSLQLVAIASMMIVCKYEEIYPPMLKDYFAVCDNAYSKEQILEMEGRIIELFDFELTSTSSFVFLEHLQLTLKLEPKAFVFVRYILENSLFDLNSLKYTNFTLVCGAIFLVDRIFKRGNIKKHFDELVQTDKAEVKQCARDLFLCMQKMENIDLTALKRKFSVSELFEVSKYRIEKNNMSES